MSRERRLRWVVGGSGVAIAILVALGALFVFGRKSFASSLPPSVDGGPEPTFRVVTDSVPPGTWARPCSVDAVFWAQDDNTLPEDLTYSVSTSNSTDINTSPTVTSTSWTESGQLMVRVTLTFANNAVRDSSRIDVTVTFTDRDGQPASLTMSIDQN